MKLKSIGELGYQRGTVDEISTLKLGSFFKSKFFPAIGCINFAAIQTSSVSMCYVFLFGARARGLHRFPN